MKAAIKAASPLLAIAALFGCASLTRATPDLSIETVGNRADLVSGGDVLVRVKLPGGAEPLQALLTLNGKRFEEPAHINNSFLLGGARLTGLLQEEKGKPTYLALISGLKDGANRLELTSAGHTVRLDVTNNPNGGPLFSGPQIQPWTCREGAFDAQCNRATSYAWSYMPVGATQFKPYDTQKPPTDVAKVTANGVQLPYIVRTESFTQNRSGVSVATLWDQDKQWDAYYPQPQWNRGVLVLQGSGCGTGYGEQPAGSPLNDRALKQGFAVVTVALLHNTINCNPVVQAEAAMMAKEHVAETYGPFDFVFGTGSSGGAISQIMDQNAYPGLYDGLILNHLFADSDASRRAAYDCRMIYDAWAKPGALPWTDAQKIAVVGMLSGCTSSPTRFQIYDPAIGTGCEVADEKKFHPENNRAGVRCTLQDYEVNQVGRRTDGYAFGRLDTTGVQFGLKALLAGTIAPAQFLELNAAIGGHDINFKPIFRRTEADRAGLSRLYTTGIANTVNNLADTPIIETRLSVTDFHQPYHAEMVRARLDRAQGHHDNYALWRTPAAREAGIDAAFDVMVQWIKAIQADARNVPKSQKIKDNRPALAKDRCIVASADAAMTACPPPLELARTLAGAPAANDTGKCELKPLRQSDYPGVMFTTDQWNKLHAPFPNGVCDYSKPLIGFAMTTPWLAYSGNGEAKPLGPAPRSH